MKRDMELIKKILIYTEEQTDSFSEIQIPGYEREEIVYHVILLCEAGLMQASILPGDDEEEAYPQRLTWQGHEFLDAARNETVWNKVKEKTKGGTLPFEVFKSLLVEGVKQLFS